MTTFHNKNISITVDVMDHIIQFSLMFESINLDTYISDILTIYDKETFVKKCTDDIFRSLYKTPYDIEMMEFACMYNNIHVFDGCIKQGIQPTERCMLYTCRFGHHNLIERLVNLKIEPIKKYLFYCQDINCVGELVKMGLMLDDDCVDHLDNITSNDWPDIIKSKYPKIITKINTRRKELQRCYKNLDSINDCQHFTLDDIINIPDKKLRKSLYALYKAGTLSLSTDMKSKTPISNTDTEKNNEMTKYPDIGFEPVIFIEADNIKPIPREVEVIKRKKKVGKVVSKILL